MNTCRSLPKAFLSCVRIPCICFRPASSAARDHPFEVSTSQQQADGFTAKDVEFSPNRPREVLQNCVEASRNHQNEDPFAKGKDFTPAVPMSERDHMEAYQGGNNVSLNSVMQSNVPDPFSRRGKAPTHLNMPGGSCSQDYKYLSGQMQKTHQSKH